MKIRRFYGSNIRSALRQVTEEFGNDAAILSNKKVAGGVEVIAALDYDDSLVPNRLVASSQTESSGSNESNSTQSNLKQDDLHQDDSLHRKSTQQQSHADSSLSENLSPDTFSQSATSKDLNQESSVVNNRDFSSELREQIAAGNFQSDLPDQAPKTFESRIEKVEWSLDPSLQAMKEELGLMRSMMSEQLKGISWHKFSDQNPLSAMIIRRLSKLGLDSEMLNSILPHIVQQSDAECAWQQVLAILAKSIPVGSDDILEPGGVVALMGPTGVGKTTTIAKLAARYVIKHGPDSVALISTDNYRISGQEQLATFGRILQVPTAVVNERNSLTTLIKKFASKRLILVDTAGISLADTHLSKQLEQFQQSTQPIRKLLTLSASCQGAVLQQTLNYFNRFGVDGVIVTKLDEAASLGELLSVVTKAHKPIIYTTDGQRIPEDIRLARSHHLVSKAVWLASKYASDSDDWELAQTIDQVKSA